MSSQLGWANEIIEKLLISGVETFCVCSGARNAAFIEILSQSSEIEVLYFVDERSAAFFALGRALEYEKPVVICTTSGTAVAELLPATIEACYVGAPLVLLTADRPPRFRGSGAPQAIDQLKFLSDHVCSQWDLMDGESNFKLKNNGPMHINVCFEEPVMGIPSEVKPPSAFVELGKKPLVILGALSPSEQSQVRHFLNSHTGYFVAEAHSGLRGETFSMGELPMGALDVKNFGDNFDSVIRIGGVPTLRLWRDLEMEFSDIPVVSFSEKPFSGLGREVTPPRSMRDLKSLTLSKFSVKESLKGRASQWEKKRDQLKLEFPKSELALVAKMSEELPASSRVFLGNSLPIREWDLVAALRTDLKIWSQRGVNGIDGLISTFLGRAQSNNENVLLIGDLSAIYDTNAFWTFDQTLKRLQGTKLKVVVMNNRGGRIFRRLFENMAMQTPHDKNFSEFSKLFGWEYFCWNHCSQWKWEGLPEQCLIELQPDLEQSDHAWKLLNE